MTTKHDSICQEILMNAPSLKGESPFRKIISEKLQQLKHKFVVLDDDPTGVQTVHDVHVITGWDKELIMEGLKDHSSVLYILTNTRSYEANKAAAINTEIIRNLIAAAQELDVDFSVISRSDSTLRGHYPLEISIIEKILMVEMNWEISGHLIIPAFFEGNRYTAENTHYLLENQKLIPVNETEFAKDTVFGFSTANLHDYIIEKSAGKRKLNEILTISLDDIRNGGTEHVVSILNKAQKNAPIVVNAVNYQDLDIVSLALLEVIGQGKHFLFRTAASFVKSLGGFKEKPFLEAEEMVGEPIEEGNGGLLVVGSHTKKTTEQLSDLISEIHVKPIEIMVDKILSPSQKQKEFIRVANLLEDSIINGHDTVLYTSRTVIKADNKDDNLIFSQTISNTLVELVKGLKVRPRFIMAKGGITSSDIATKGLGIKKARILGQAAPGVPVLLTGDEARIPNTAYIVFPGNVGEQNTITEIFKKINKLTL